MKRLLLFVGIISCAIIRAQAPKDGFAGGKGSGTILERYDVISKTDPIKNGHCEKWYMGVKIVSGEYVNGIKHGLWKSQSVDGKVFFQGNYTNNKMTGIWKYYQDQKRLCTGYFKDDKKDSTWQSFYPGGSTHCITTYKNGLRSGPFKLFYENGKIKNEGFYVNDSLSGPYLRYHSNGNIVSNIEYKADVPFDVISMADSSGKTIDHGTFKQGNGSLITYSLGGLKRSTTNYLQGQKDGTETILFETGKTFSLVPYKAGKKEGSFISFYSNGKTQEKSEYKKGEMVSGSYVNNPDEALRVLDTKSIDQMNDDDKLSYPVSLGGEPGMMSFIQANVTYPLISIIARTQGTVYVTFIVCTDGTIGDIKILRGVSPEIDVEAANVVSIMPAWIPGFQYGLPANAQFNLPIKFILR